MGADPGADLWTLNFTNLLPGTNYELQVWVNDSRTYFYFNTEILGDLTGTNSTATLTIENGSVAGAVGTYAIGTATADAHGTISATLTNGVTGPNNIVTMAINAFQLRQLGVVTPPTLTIHSVSGNIQISWTGPGFLQQAPVLTGPWTTTTNGGLSPYTVVPSGSQQFYRLKY